MLNVDWNNWFVDTEQKITAETWIIEIGAIIFTAENRGVRPWWNKRVVKWNFKYAQIYRLSQ
jgi:hypothetical protein